MVTNLKHEIQLEINLRSVSARKSNQKQIFSGRETAGKQSNRTGQRRGYQIVN